MNRIDKIKRFLDKTAEWSLYILIFALFSKSLVEITIVTGLVSIIAKKLIARERLLNGSRIDIFLYIFLLASLISFINTSSIHLSLRAFFSKSLKFAALFLMTKEIINTKEKLNNFITMALLSCAIILTDGFTQYYVTHKDFLLNYNSFLFVPGYSQGYLGVPTSSFPFPNDYAAWILVFIFPAGAFAVLGRRGLLKSIIAGAVSTGLFYTLMLTRVRGALLGFLISFALMAILKLKRYGIILLVIVLISMPLLDKSLLAHVQSVVSVKDRVVMWKNGWEIFKAHPVIGNGLNTFYVNYMNIRNDDLKGKHGSYAHNCYLQMAAEIGITGLISFLLFVTAIIAKTLKSLKTMTDPTYYSLTFGLTFGLVAYLLHSFVDTNLYSLNLAALFWVSAGLLLAAVKLSESNV